MGLVVEPKKIGLILGGGASRGSLHIGTLEVLEEHGIVPHLVLGVSVGSVIGAAYVASGCSTTLVKKTFYSFKDSTEIFRRKSIIQIAKIILSEVLALTERLPRIQKAIAGQSGIYEMEPLINIIAKIEAPYLMNAPQEFVAETIRRVSGEVVYFSNKDPNIIADFQREDRAALLAACAAFPPDAIYPASLRDALQRYAKMQLALLGSCAIEGFFAPVSILHHGSYQEYYDPGGRRPLPILQAIKRGCDTIIVSRCHSDALREPAPDGILGPILHLGIESSNQLEKEEIKTAREKPINFFNIEPRSISPSHKSIPFQRGDHQKAAAHMKEVARETLAPLIEYFRNIQNSGSGSSPASSSAPDG